MLQLLSYLLNALLVLVFIYLVVSWTKPNLDGVLGKILRPPFALVEMLMGLIKLVLPARGGRDYSALILFFLIWAIQQLVFGF